MVLAYMRHMCVEGRLFVWATTSKTRLSCNDLTISNVGSVMAITLLRPIFSHLGLVVVKLIKGRIRLHKTVLKLLQKQKVVSLWNPFKNTT